MPSNLKIAFLIVVLGFLYSGYEFYNFYEVEVARMQNEIRGLDSQFKGKQGQLRRLKKFSENIEQIKKELKELNIQFNTAKERMPSEFDLSSLLRQLTQIAKSSGVELRDFNPDSQEKRPAGAFYATTMINFDVTGPFTQCLVFYDQITRLKRIINLDSINMKLASTSRTGNADNGFGPLNVSARTKIMTYRFAR